MSNQTGWNDTSGIAKMVCFTQEMLDKAQANATAKGKSPDQYLLMDTVQGIYRGKKTIMGGRTGSILLYLVELANGETVSIMDSMTLATKFNKGNKNNPIPEGSEVLIKYLGIKASKKTAGNTYHDYDVKWRAPSFQDATTEMNGSDEEDVDESNNLPQY